MKIMVKVAPNSRVEAVSRSEDGFMVKVKEPPSDGRANKAVVKLLAEYFKVPQSSVRVVSGLGSRNKLIEVKGK
jgi:hypothetical protein